jgi:polar amino acid transport system substrate-binding protein
MIFFRKSFLLMFLVFSSSVCQAEKWVLTTLEWPPYTCSQCPGKGAAAKALAEALKKQNIELEFVFLPWTEAIKAGADKTNVGYFPAWLEDVKPGFVTSVALFESPLGFLEPKARPLRWNKLSDLKGKTIGVTKDYGNTVEFNRLVAEGVIKTEVVESDDTNMRKVALGKLDGTLIDLNNARYFLDNSLKSISGEISINPKILEKKELYVALNSHDTKKHADVIMAAMKKGNLQKSIDAYMVKYMGYPATTEMFPLMMPSVASFR